MRIRGNKDRIGLLSISHSHCTPFAWLEVHFGVVAAIGVGFVGVVASAYAEFVGLVVEAEKGSFEVEGDAVFWVEEDKVV